MKLPDRINRIGGWVLVVVCLVGAIVFVAGKDFGPTELDDLYDETTRGDEGNDHRQLAMGFGGNYQTSKLLEKFQLARAKFMEKLAVDYGQENVPVIFQRTNDDGAPVSVTRTVFSGTPTSWNRMKRKVVMKILKAQIQKTDQSFVWATGGHSAAAAHGNLLDESYTAVLEKGSFPIFEAVGLHFTARNYGMGGTSCGMEIASCMKEVFGLDVDALVWDYGMTTAGSQNKGRVELYFHRAALLPSRPAILGQRLGQWRKILNSMEPLGLAVFDMDLRPIETTVPDTAGKTQDEIDKMPRYIRSFRCGKSIEKGDPTCHAEKYTTLPNDDPCNNRKGRVSWHPGWKWHGLYGNLMSLFWIEIIDDALKEIIERGSDPEALLRTLKNEEDLDFVPLMSKNISLIQYVDKQLDETADIPNEIIYWNPNYCHIAHTPSESRYKGILTESDIKGGYTQYDKGHELNEVVSTSNDQMELTWDKGLYQPSCKNYQIDIDYQDFFMVNSLGFSKLVLPNKSEKAMYGSKNGEPLVGYILVCFAGCGWHCPKNTLSSTDVVIGGSLLMTVNGVNVQSYEYFGGKDCMFLNHAGGHKWTPNDHGQFELSAKALNASMYFRFSSIIIW